MIIVKIIGGLGNQLFQYALCKELITLGKNVKIDISAYEMGIEKRRLSGHAKDFEAADRKEIDGLCDNRFTLPDRVRRRLGFYKDTHIIEDVNRFMGHILQMDNVYLDGYWQNENYFKDVINDMKQYICCTDSADSDTLREIARSESVSVHIRRGDYLKFNRVYGGICTPDYYKNAMNYLKARLDNPKFYFFSDDLEWVKDNFQDAAFVYVTPDGENPENDIYLMSRCKHNIIANSSFSWWGARLNNNPEQIVIAPTKWENNSKRNLSLNAWIKM